MLPNDALPGRFTHVTPLAEGTFGRVYRAQDDQGRAVALKVLAARWAKDPAAAWQFEVEYRHLARLHHPAFPRAYEEGRTATGLPFYAMELVDGRGLDALAPLPALEVRRVLGKLAEALEALHALGWVHQDLKPENVLAQADGRLVVLDVGQVAAIGSAREAIAGTPEYMAPEVFRKEAVDPAADWYALGALAFHLLVGQPPFAGPPAAQLRAHLLEAAPEARPAVGPADEVLTRLVAALLSKDPAARPAGAGVAKALGL
ncbi:MAG: hypothetical protein JWM80_306, partial [Cyanobacteria bacterium RYN_339]|nr:hypothetical protein [Cyanobacteria bacterium RYN_339]